MVTAGGSGMGRAGALQLAAEGAHVYVADLRGEAAAETAATIEAAGGSAVGREVDVSDNAALRALFDEVERDRGVLHALWNHAGMAGVAGLDAADADWQLNVDVNLKGAYYGSSYAADLLAAAEGSGSILLTASTSGLVGSAFSPLYSMAKGGIAVMAKAIALNLAPRGIRCNAICPGPIETPMLPEFLNRDEPENVDPALLTGFADSMVPLKRLGQPEEVARVAVFLLSDDASYVTGVAMPVDGGLTAR